MKRIIFILTLALVGVSASAQNNIYKAVVGVHKNAEGSVVVSDPSTTLAVDLTFETEQVVVGPYAKYAQKYLETRGALVDKSTTSLKSAKIAIVTDDALAASAIAEPTTSVTSYMGTEAEFAKISPDRLSSSAMSLDDAAAQAAQASGAQAWKAGCCGPWDAYKDSYRGDRRRYSAWATLQKSHLSPLLL